MPIIKLKGGVKANMPVLDQKELAYCTDTDEVYVGDGVENHPIGHLHAALSEPPVGCFRIVNIWMDEGKELNVQYDDVAIE